MNLVHTVTDTVLRVWSESSDSGVPLNVAALESYGAITQRIGFDTALNHLIVDQNTGRVFVGGVNRLYQLSPDLDIQAIAVTGPQNDSTDCTALECTKTDTVRTLTDNYNKALLIDYSTSRLIACGSVFQGVCTVRNLQNASIVEQEIVEGVVANTDTASTVAFIGPGPPLPSITNVMYVAVTYTGNSKYRSEIPAVSSRSLERGRMFRIASEAVTTGTRMFINSYARESYIVNYVYGFSSEGFSYFLTTQLKHNFHSTPKEYITKLVRICQEDSNYYSYTEIPVDCVSESLGGTRYNLVTAAYLGIPGTDLAESLGVTPEDDVLYAVFSEGKENVPNNRSALCVYSLKAIRRKFMQNIKACFNGNGARGLDFISPNMNCVATKLQRISEDFCGLDVNSPLGGEQPIAAITATLIPHQLTAVAVTRTSGYTVAFIGTLDGHLKKFVVESATSAIEYADIAIDEGSRVKADMHFDAQELNLYVMTKNKVAKVKVHDCTTVFQTCSACLGAKDPYCGWCSLENKCSLRSNCRVDTNDPLFWVSYETGKCTTIMNVSPHQLQRTTTRTIELHIVHLPPLKEQLICAFIMADKPTIYTNASIKRNGVNCTTPWTDLLPQIPQGKHNFTMKLSVRTENGPDLVSTNFTFFDCSTHLSCTECVSSQFPCDWCIEEHRCTHDTAENCRDDTLVTGARHIGPSYRSGSAFCPTINATKLGNEILVAHGSTKLIEVHVMGNFTVQPHFLCQFNIEGRIASVSAQLLGDTISCNPMEFSYTSQSPNVTVTFAVIWGGSKPLDNPHNIHVVIYRCRDMCDSCGTCLVLPGKYNCGWCQSTSTCEIEDLCGKENEQINDWLNRRQTCPNPKIQSFKPITGPWEGGTNITIRGINLGKNFTDIYSGVKVAGIGCMPYQDLYVDTKEIVCTVDSVQKYRSGTIIVEIADYRAESTYDYEFVDPQIEDFNPKSGPVSGGTQVTIVGKHLNAGSRIKAFIAEQQCEILSADDTHALCRTSRATDQNRGNLKMTFDNGVREFDGDPYEYVKDPTIEYVSSGPTGQWKSPKGIPAGGIKITVVGNQFEAVQQPNMYVYFEGKTYLSECKVISNTEMTCYSPSIDDPDHSDQLKNLNADAPAHLEYGFKMDDVMEVRNLSNKDNHHPFELYPNPVYLSFEENVKYFKSEYLTINGRNLDRACRESDVVVMVGNGICNITSISRQQMTCRPPAEATDANEAPTVSVRVGNVLNYEIGVLSYASPNLMHGLTRHALFGVIAVAAVFVLLFALLFLLVLRLRVQQHPVATEQFNATTTDNDHDNNSSSRTHQDNPSYNMPAAAGAVSKASPSTFTANIRQRNKIDYCQSIDEPIYYEIPEQPPDEYDRLSFSKRNPIAEHYF